ncbi:ComEC/Rec2 family competence protein [Leifsonia sp. ZF2019]|nr:ComEC/Rec2 family competence protein [Leifsonia sp. ZF2019]
MAVGAGVGAAALVAAAAWMRRGRRRVLVAAVMAAGVALGGAVTAVRAPERTAAVLEEAAAEHRAVTLTVRVDGPARPVAMGLDGRPRWSWRGTATAADAQGESSRVSPSRAAGRGIRVPITVFSDGEEGAGSGVPTIGAAAMVSGTLRRNEPGEATSFRVAASTAPREVERAPAWLSWTAPVREAFATAARTMPGDGGALLPGLAIGDESAVPSDLDEAMKASSLSHLTAVSGANCALVTGLVFVVSARLGAGRRLRLAIAGGALLAFVVLVGPGASILRAAVMAIVVLVALARGRPADGLPALGLAVIVLLVHDPWMARDYGFALSVAATAGLLLLAGPIARALTRWMPRQLALGIAIPAAAQLACQPILVLLSPTLPLYGVVANLLAEPAAPIATVLGCLACLVLLWAPMLGEVLVRLAWLPSAWIAQIAHTAAGLPGAALPWLEGLPGVLACSAAVIVVGTLSRGRRLPRAVTAAMAATLAAGIVAYAGILAGGAVGRALAIPPDWQIAACDVGQGDALLVRGDGGVAMIDVGRTPEAAAACLDRLGVERIALLVLTHYDADHVGGLPGVVERVDGALVGHADGAADEAVLRALAARAIPVAEARRGMSGVLGSLQWDVLWPAATGADVPTGNDGSVVVRTSGAGLTGLFLGDLGERSQGHVLRAGGLGGVDVLKVAHHGSADQSERLTWAVAARVGLVSVGAGNGYGHPTARALGLVEAAGGVVARTDRQGLVLVAAGSEGPRVWSERRTDADAGGRPYPGGERGGTWRPETAAAAARAAPERPRPVRPPVPSRSSPGTRSGRLRSCWCPARRASWRTAPSGRCVMRSRPTTRVSRSATSPHRTTHPVSCSRSRAPPCSASRG